jgi:hypothetical protein
METKIVVYKYNAANLAVDSTFVTFAEEVRITNIVHRSDVAGTDAGAVTGEIRKVPAGSAVSAGTVLHTGTINLKAAASTVTTLTLATADATRRLNAGESLGFDLTGVATAAVGSVTVSYETIEL